MRLRDKHGRYITDLRVSITDRCNYRCVYCRTGNSGAQYSELPFADYLRLVRIFVGLGIEKVRLTGGEPLLRNGLVDFVRDVAPLRTLDGQVPDIAITTNGHLLAELAEPLKQAGLRRATISMDAVDPAKFARITRVSGGFERVLAGPGVCPAGGSCQAGVRDARSLRRKHAGAATGLGASGGDDSAGVAIRRSLSRSGAARFPGRIQRRGRGPNRSHFQPAA